MPVETSPRRPAESSPSTRRLRRSQIDVKPNALTQQPIDASFQFSVPTEPDGTFKYQCKLDTEPDFSRVHVARDLPWPARWPAQLPGQGDGSRG